MECTWGSSLLIWEFSVWIDKIINHDVFPQFFHTRILSEGGVGAQGARDHMKSRADIDLLLLPHRQTLCLWLVRKPVVYRGYPVSEFDDASSPDKPLRLTFNLPHESYKISKHDLPIKIIWRKIIFLKTKPISCDVVFYMTKIQKITIYSTK